MYRLFSLAHNQYYFDINRVCLFVYPICTVFCEDLPELQNGSISYDQSDSPRPLDTVATHECNDGFELIGVEIRVCSENGQFSGTAPTCECKNLLMSS